MHHYKRTTVKSRRQQQLQNDNEENWILDFLRKIISASVGDIGLQQAAGIPAPKNRTSLPGQQQNVLVVAS